MRITIIGVGNMGGAIARGLIQGDLVQPADITCTAKSTTTLQKLRDFHPDLVVTNDNLAATRNADIIICAVKPWLMETIIDEIRPALDFKKQIFASVAAGIDLETLRMFLLKGQDFETIIEPTIFRIIPNTAIAVKNSMTFMSAYHSDAEQTDLLIRIFNELGKVLLVEERLMAAGTALASCGIAFALRYIRAAMEGGVELGFYPHQAQEIVAQTVKGATELLLSQQTNPEIEIDKVTTPGGITIKGLNEMELAGFTAAVVRGLRASK